MKIIITIFTVCLFILGAKAQDAGELRGDGIVIPSLTTTERNAIPSVEEGHLIYNETTDEVQVRRNGAWQALGSSGGGGATWRIQDLNEMNTAVSAIDAATNYVQLTVEGDASWYWYYNSDGDIRVHIANKENSDNTFIGEDAGQANTLNIPNKDGWQNTFIGNEAGSENSTGSYNTFVGNSAGLRNNTADNNTFVGRAAGDSFSSGAHNTILGSRALSSGTSATRNVAIGSEAGLTSVASDNIFIGYQAGRNGTDSGADENVGIGTEALEDLGMTTGGTNQSRWNTAVGFQAGKNTDLGYNNVFVGKDAGEANEGGYNNTFVGYTAGEENTSGHHNTYIGDDAGFSVSDGSYNVMIGTSSGGASSGASNTYIGESAGRFNAGSGNVFIGHEAGRNVSGGPIQDVNNTLVISNDDDETLIYGEFDNKIVRIDGELFVSSLETGTGFAHDVHVTNDGKLIRTTSDRRLKKNVKTLQGSLEKLLLLRGVSFEWKDGENPNNTLGVIAQEVLEVFPDVVYRTDEESYYGVNYSEFTGIFIEAIKEQQKIIDELQKKHAEELSELRTMIRGSVTTSNLVQDKSSSQ